MRQTIVSTAVIALAAMAMLTGIPLASSATQPAGYVLTNGKIYTVSKQQPWAEAVIVKGNKIAYVGDNAGAKAHVGEGMEEVDLGGKMLLPGFVSAHDHLIAAQWKTKSAALRWASTRIWLSWRRICST